MPATYVVSSRLVCACGCPSHIEKSARRLAPPPRSLVCSVVYDRSRPTPADSDRRVAKPASVAQVNPVASTSGDTEPEFEAPPSILGAPAWGMRQITCRGECDHGGPASSSADLARLEKTIRISSNTTSPERIMRVRDPEPGARCMGRSQRPWNAHGRDDRGCEQRLRHHRSGSERQGRRNQELE